jgi:hypothetical protein
VPDTTEADDSLGFRRHVVSLGLYETQYPSKKSLLITVPAVDHARLKQWNGWAVVVRLNTVTKDRTGWKMSEGDDFLLFAKSELLGAPGGWWS